MEILEGLLEPFAELFLELLLQPFEIFFESIYSLLKWRVRYGDRLTIIDLHSPAEQLHPPSPGRTGDQLRSFESLQDPFDLVKVVKIVHPLRPSAELPNGLWPPEHQYAEQRHLPPPEIQDLAKAVGKLLYAMASAADADYKMFSLKCFERLLHRPLIKLHHRIAARFLITSIL